jgi:predicted CoA-binding protein
MPLLKKVGSSACFRKGKHAGETVDAVATKDPGYLGWAWRQENISDEEFYLLDDAAKAHKVQTGKMLTQDNQKFRKQRVTTSVTRKMTKR